MASNRSREEDIITAFATAAGVTFPSFDLYREFTPAQRYIANLAQRIRSTESLVAEQANRVRRNVERTLEHPDSLSSLGVIQGSGPMLDVYVATLTERREQLTVALGMLCLAPADTDDGPVVVQPAGKPSVLYAIPPRAAATPE